MARIHCPRSGKIIWPNCCRKPIERDAKKGDSVKPTSRTMTLAAVFATCCCAVLFAQYSGNQPQPVADRLPAPGRGTANVSRRVTRPDDAMPKVPAGFKVSVYAELPAPRMMVYAPNGDLFVSSPDSYNITVLRDANNDGVFEARSVFAQGTPPARGNRGTSPPPP